MKEPGAGLVDLERELEALLVEYESLSRAWPKEPHAVARAEIGRQVEDALARIGELQYAIVASPADTLVDAAVKLRRLDALLDGEDPARQLLSSALAVVETAVNVDGHARWPGQGMISAGVVRR